MTRYMLTKPAQAMTYDKGYFYPGPAVKDVTLAMAPEDSQEVIKEYGRPIYAKLIADVPSEVPLAGRQAGLCVPALGPADRREGRPVSGMRVSHEFRELRLDGISREFGSLNALSDVSLTVKRGEFIALLGPSGCGKSTALNCLAGLLPLTAGAIWLDEKRIDTLGPEQRGFGMVFQNYALFPHMSVRRNVGFGLVTQRRPKAEIARRVEEALALVRLDRTGREAARPALGRPAAARGDRPRHRGGAAAGADGRAAVQPRRQAAAGDAGRDPAHPFDGRLCRRSTSRMTRTRRCRSPTASW